MLSLDSPAVTSAALCKHECSVCGVIKSTSRGIESHLGYKIRCGDAAHMEHVRKRHMDVELIQLLEEAE